MTKPERTQWATDPTYPAGGDAWSSQPNKIEPVAGKFATGTSPAERPPAPEWNWWRSRCAEWFNWIQALSVRNWFETDFTAVTPWQSTRDLRWQFKVGAVPAKRFLGADADGNLAVSERDGSLWRSEAGGGMATALGLLAAPPYTRVQLQSNINNQTVVAVADDGATANVIVAGTVDAAWAFPAGPTVPTPGQRWSVIDNNFIAGGSGLWAIGSRGGIIDITADGLHYTRGVYNTPPNPINVLVHNKDSDNPYWMALQRSTATGDTTVLRSADGVTWQATGIWVAMPSDPCAIAYDKQSRRWMVLFEAVAGDIYYSDDNGLSWGVFTAAVPWSAVSTHHLACDGAGGWVAAGVDTLGPPDIDIAYASIDNGVTWERLVRPVSHHSGGALIYADNRFCALRDGPAPAASGACQSLIGG